MKRHLSPRGCTFPPPSRNKRRPLQLAGSPSSAVLKTGQDCLEQGQSEMDRETLQSTSAYKRQFLLEGSQERGNTDRGFDLNATPYEPLGSDMLSLPFRIDRRQQENDAHEADARDDIGVDQPAVEPIDVEENADEITDFLPNIDDSAVQWFNELFVVNDSFDQPAVSIIDADSYITQPTRTVVEVDLINDNTTLFSSPRVSTQVQNQTMEVVRDVIALDEESDIKADSPDGLADEEVSTRLTLGIYPLRRAISHGNLNHKHFAMSTENGQQKVAVSCPEPQAKEPKDPTFTCPICWGPFVEEYSTICGHIFCHACIKSSIKAQKKCPTCRRKLSRRNIHRVYLPIAI